MSHWYDKGYQRVNRLSQIVTSVEPSGGPSTPSGPVPTSLMPVTFIAVDRPRAERHRRVDRDVESRPRPGQAAQDG